MSFDVLQEKIIALKNPTVAGLDPKPEYVPEHIRRESYGRYGETLEGAADAVLQFNKGLIDALCDIVPAVKPQSAYYERLGWHGMIALEQTIRYAHGKGMYVIADIKRGDIGSTAEAYADAWLGATKVGETLCQGFGADCVTLNGYMGADSVNPFLKVAGERDKCVFILAKTSNPGSGELQNVTAGDNDTVYGLMADLIEKWGAGTRRGRAVRLPGRGERRHRQLIPGHHLRLAEDRKERRGLPGGGPERRHRHAGRHLPVCLLRISRPTERQRGI